MSEIADSDVSVLVSHMGDQLEKAKVRLKDDPEGAVSTANSALRETLGGLGALVKGAETDLAARETRARDKLDRLTATRGMEIDGTPWELDSSAVSNRAQAWRQVLDKLPKDRVLARVKQEIRRGVDGGDRLALHVLRGSEGRLYLESRGVSELETMSLLAETAGPLEDDLRESAAALLKVGQDRASLEKISQSAADTLFKALAGFKTALDQAEKQQQLAGRSSKLAHEEVEELRGIMDEFAAWRRTPRVS